MSPCIMYPFKCQTRRMLESRAVIKGIGAVGGRRQAGFNAVHSFDMQRLHIIH